MGQWKLIEKIGEGGNGEVWSTHKLDNIENKNYAIKLLKKIKLKSYLRFRDEINVLLKIKDIEGVLPIIEHHLPDKDEENDLPWYVMPIAVRIKSYLKDKTSENIVEALISITKTLNDLHDHNIFHRDIKPVKGKDFYTTCGKDKCISPGK